MILNQFFAWLDEWTGLSKIFCMLLGRWMFHGLAAMTTLTKLFFSLKSGENSTATAPATTSTIDLPARRFVITQCTHHSTGQENAYARHAKCSSLGLLRVSQQGTAEEFFPAVKLFVPLLHSLTRGEWCWVRTLPSFIY